MERLKKTSKKKFFIGLIIFFKITSKSTQNKFKRYFKSKKKHNN